MIELANTLPLAVIFDLDNVVWDATMLNQYLPADKKSRAGWSEFEKHYKEVTPNAWAVELVNFYRSLGRTLLFITSREDINNCKSDTIDSLSTALSNDLSGAYLYMRQPEDYRPSAEVKKEIYLKEIQGIFKVMLAVDDDRSNCEMWHSFGIDTLHKLVD
jgi:predicted secreted acid phosphatase